MMRSLLMLRHGKSDWKAEYGGDDLLRPLSRRGRSAATSVGRFLSLLGEVPDLVVVSPAVRAQQTADLAHGAGKWSCRVETSEALYGDVDAVLTLIRATSSDFSVLMIVGHEPTWSTLASRLTGGAKFQLPTASLLRLEFPTEDWTSIDEKATIRFLVTPSLLVALSHRGAYNS